MKVWLRRKRNPLGEFSSTWNEFAVKTENDKVLEKICRIWLNSRLRQKMKFS